MKSCRRFSSAGLASITAIASAADLSEASLRAADAEQMRIIVRGDADKQRTFMHPNYMVNGPSNRVMRKEALVEMLAQGKMASDSFVFEDGEWRFLARQATIVGVR